MSSNTLEINFDAPERQEGESYPAYKARQKVMRAKQLNSKYGKGYSIHIPRIKDTKHTRNGSAKSKGKVSRGVAFSRYVDFINAANSQTDISNPNSVLENKS